MRLVGLFGVKNQFDEADITGVTIDVVMGLLAGLALIVAIWLLSGVLAADTAQVASGALTR